MTREEQIHNAYKKHLLTEGNPSNGFEYGARWADNNPVNPWHKVSEELPKESGSYIVKYTIGSCSVLYNGICTYNECRWINARLLGGGRITITHWMPIPELPKED